MHQGLSTSRLGLAFVLVAFCFPLFVGLGQNDLEADEAAYSFSVDRILEIGDWLAPKSSPSETAVFLEKPPLKVWIVAAAIRAGVLPHNEFGLRFWDAVCGGAAFLYVFGIGSAMAGPVCGLVAVLLLFVHGPLVFDHGLRTNNMESALFLSYCGGVCHFLGWEAADRRERRRLHAVLVGLFFVLGFMTKFVAAMFLPLVLGASALIVRTARTKATQDRRLWAWVLALVLVLTAPWFVYAQLRFGRAVWDTMLVAHMPWNFYFVSMYRRFAESKSAGLVLVGMAVLLADALRGRSFGAVVTLLWGTLPVTLISLGSSKLYHDVYPFLPPLTLASGYAIALVALLARAPLRRLLEAAEDLLARWLPQLGTVRTRNWLRLTTTLAIWLAAILAVAAAIDIPIRIAVRGLAFTSSGLLRPFLAIVLAAVAAGRSTRVVQLLVALAIFGLLPGAAYFSTLSRLGVERHPRCSVRDSIRDVQARVGGIRPGETPLPAALDHNLHNPDASWPSLVAVERCVSPPTMSLPGYILFLPGPQCVQC